MTHADGSVTVKTLAELGITEIALVADATRLDLQDACALGPWAIRALKNAASLHHQSQ
ncbi:MAG: hypothetical protein U1E15_12445 [Hyphomicrobiales bacterium]